MSVFKHTYKLLLLFLLLFVTCSGRGKENSPSLKSLGYNIVLDDNQKNEKWALYLFDHLANRTGNKNCIKLNDDKKGFKNIKIEINDRLDSSYCLEHSDKLLVLKAKDEKTILWLIYQLIKMLSNCDNRFVANDLPPAIINYSSHCHNFDFDYREPHFSPNLREEYALIIGTNKVETDWGIWGHNLNKILRKDKNNLIYAKDGTQIRLEQFCFSNDEIFIQLQEYILDNFGDEKEYTQRFMIMPNDNPIVCNCALCLSNGNMEADASPALSVLIRRLASRFPYHSFFTSAYLSVTFPPKEKFPSNSGVMISTIDLPKGVALKKNKETDHFLNALARWKKCTPNVYIWDYAANFDDYLTPIPVLGGLKDQLEFYKSNGIAGVFLNASGYDYSTFEDMKTYVSSALMIDTRLSVDSLCNLFFTQYYPVSGEALSSYYLSLERRMKERGIPYNLYGSFQNTLNTYLNKDEFVAFYNLLPTLIAVAKGEEKQKLEQLYTALSFSRLQIAYVQRDSIFGFATLRDGKLRLRPEITAICERLSKYTQYKDFQRYKEVGGELGAYLDSWSQMHQQSSLQNLLMDKPLRVLSELDEEYTQIRMLNDGVPGFAGDYHQGWLVSSLGDLHIQFNVRDMEQAKTVLMRFLVDERHHLYPPEKISIYKDDKLYKEIVPISIGDPNTSGIVEAEADISFFGTESVSVKMHRRRENRSIIACDEIILL